MSHLLDEILAQAANGSPATAALSSESVAVLLFASRFIEERKNWLDREEFPADEVTDADWDAISSLVANVYYEIMNPIIGFCFPLLTALPDNCLLLDGSTYEREDYPVLYDALDGVFIVDADHFVLPDMRSRIPIGAGTGSGLSTYAVNQTGGEEQHQLTVSEMPGHQHSISLEIPIVAAPGVVPINSSTGVPAGGTGFTGGDAPHNNIQPFTALPWAVVAL